MSERKPEDKWHELARYSLLFIAFAFLISVWMARYAPVGRDRVYLINRFTGEIIYPREIVKESRVERAAAIEQAVVQKKMAAFFEANRAHYEKRGVSLEAFQADFQSRTDDEKARLLADVDSRMSGQSTAP